MRRIIFLLQFSFRCAVTAIFPPPAQLAQSRSGTPHFLVFSVSFLPSFFSSSSLVLCSCVVYLFLYSLLISFSPGISYFFIFPLSFLLFLIFLLFCNSFFLPLYLFTHLSPHPVALLLFKCWRVTTLWTGPPSERSAQIPLLRSSPRVGTGS
jgi:hypothetical protein